MKLSTTKERGHPGDADVQDDSTNSDKRLPRFVLYRHDPASMHFELRLEVDGVLKSWIVPGGPARDPGEKRFALRIEDCPLDGDGAGSSRTNSLMVWDSGCFRSLPKPGSGDEAHEKFRGSPENGSMRMWLEGKRLAGAYALTRYRTNSPRYQWLLTKLRDNEKGAMAEGSSSSERRLRQVTR